MEPYESNRALQLSHALALEAYRLTENFPRREWFGLAAQIRRAAYSVPFNIVEGSAKRGTLEYRKYLDTSWGSLKEYGYAVRFSRDLGFITTEDWAAFEPRFEETSKVLWGLYSSVANKADGLRKRRKR